ncbi:MAG TPA: AraC family transcriptional regulator [Armatimonadota bacterium]
MQSESASGEGKAGCQGMTLRCIWHVDSDPSYQVRGMRMHDPGLVAIRTLDGHGRVEISDAGQFELTADTVFFTDLAHVRHYGTAGKRWHFYWYEFVRDRGMNVPVYQVLPVTPTPWERLSITGAYAQLALPDAAVHVAASALFTALLYHWLVVSQQHIALTSSRKIVNQAIHQMQQTWETPLSIEELARACGISSRWLRQAFIAEFGMPPKQYFMQLRMRQAASVLQMGLGSIRELSDQLGFSSPFHFSRAFKLFFGCSPSHYTKRT